MFNFNSIVKFFAKSWGIILTNIIITSSLIVGFTPAEGPSGSIGSSGASGASGSIGATGPQGPSGVPGVTGSSGATGPQGESGLPGSSGVPGIPGSSGATGPQGESGLPGGNMETIILEDIQESAMITDSLVYANELISQQNYIGIDSFTKLALIGTSNEYPLSGKYVLTADLDFEDYGFDWTPIPGPFIGTLDGAGFTIDNFASPTPTINTAFALFNSIGDITTYQVTTIKNITFNNVNISVNHHAATLAVQSYYMVEIDRVYIENSLIESAYILDEVENYYAGGFIVEVVHSAIVRSSALVDSKVISKSSRAGGIFASSKYVLFERVYSLSNQILGRTEVGGLIGRSQGGTILQSGNTSFVYGFYDHSIGSTGGLIGEEESNRGLVIKFSFNSGTVMSSGDLVGGLIGDLDNDSYAGGIIENTFNSGDITGGEEVGGLIGRIDADKQEFRNLYNSGNITGLVEVGGIIGYGGSAEWVYLYNVYNSGSITATRGRVGGLVGEINGGEYFLYYNFNVGQVVNQGPERTFGQIIGRNNDDILFKDGYYFWDGISPVRWADEGPGAGHNGNPFLARMLTDIQRFTNPLTFVFKDVWNFNQVWEFNRDQDYSYPTLVNNLHFETPQSSNDPISFSSLMVGSSHVFAFDTDGMLFGWGLNDRGQLQSSSGDSNHIPLPILISLLDNESIVKISPASNHTLFLTSTGRLLASGWNFVGAIGDGTTTDPSRPVEITIALNTGESIVDLAAGLYHSMALTSTGRVFTWGGNDNGQLGRSFSYTPDLLPTEMVLPAFTNGETVASIYANDLMSALITNQGNLYTWGSNEYGALGLDIPSNDPISTPTLVSFTGLAPQETIESVDMGTRFMYALTTAGRLFSWGLNDAGQLGQGDTTSSDSPLEVLLTLNQGETVQQVAVGSTHVLILTSSRVFSVGRNNDGQLGNGTQINSSTPGMVSFTLLQNETIANVYASDITSFALTSQGRLFSWGGENDGELGIRYWENYSTPTLVVHIAFNKDLFESIV